MGHGVGSVHTVDFTRQVPGPFDVEVCPELALPCGRLNALHTGLDQVEQAYYFAMVAPGKMEGYAGIDTLKNMLDLDSHFVVPADFKHACKSREDVFRDGGAEVNQPVEVPDNGVADECGFVEVGEAVGGENDFDLTADVWGEPHMRMLSDAAFVGARDDEGIEFIHGDFTVVEVSVTEGDVMGRGVGRGRGIGVAVAGFATAFSTWLCVVLILVSGHESEQEPRTGPGAWLRLLHPG